MKVTSMASASAALKGQSTDAESRHHFHGRGLTRNMAVSGTSALLTFLITVLSYPIYLHFLGYVQYGLWLLVSTFITLCQLGSLGIAPALSKLIAEEIGRDNKAGAQLYIGTAISGVSLFGSAVVCLLFRFRNELLEHAGLSASTSATLHQLLPFIVILSFYAFLSDLFGAVLVGIGRTDLASGIQTVTQIVSLGCSFMLLRRGFGVMSLAVGALASMLLSQILTSGFAWRKAGLKLLPGVHFDLERAHKLFRLASTVFASSLVAAAFIPLSKFLLSKYGGLAAIPVFEMAYSGSMRLRGLFEMPLRPIMPALSHAISVSGEELDTALRDVRREVLRVLVLAGITFGTCFLFADLLLRVWLRRSFDPSLPGSVRIALIGAFLSLVGVAPYFSLLGLGKPMQLLLSHIVQSLTNLAIILAALLIFGQLSLKMLLLASSGAMGASTCFLLFRYTSTVNRLRPKYGTYSYVEPVAESV